MRHTYYAGEIMQMDDYANRCGAWLQEQVRRAEVADPQLKQLKLRISELGGAIDALNASGMDDHGEKISQLLLEYEDSISTLFQHIAQRVKRTSAA